MRIYEQSVNVRKMIRVR